MVGALTSRTPVPDSDENGHAWILQRPSTVRADQKAKGMAAPPVLEFDADGNFLHGWGGAGPSEAEAVGSNQSNRLPDRDQARDLGGIVGCRLRTGLGFVFQQLSIHHRMAAVLPATRDVACRQGFRVRCAPLAQAQIEIEIARAEDHAAAKGGHGYRDALLRRDLSGGFRQPVQPIRSGSRMSSAWSPSPGNA